MSRTEVAIDNVSLNAGATLTRTTIAAGATGTAGYAFITETASEDLKIIAQVDGATGVLTIKAGDYCANSVGDLTIVLGGGGTNRCITVDGARYRQNDGSVQVDMGGATGILMVLQ